MQRSVLSLVHHTHPPTAQLLDDPVMRDGLADHGGPGTQGCHVRSAAEAKSTKSNTLSAVEGASRVRATLLQIAVEGATRLDTAQIAAQNDRLLHQLLISPKGVTPMRKVVAGRIGIDPKTEVLPLVPQATSTQK